MSLRKFINQIINESLKPLCEAQRGQHFDSYVELTFSNLTPFIDPLYNANINISDLNLDNTLIMKEVNNLLNIKINKVFLQTFNYTDLYVISLGDFIVKTNKGDIKLSFNKKGDEHFKYSYPYIYVYHDILEVLRFGSRFLDTDASIIKKANEFLSNRNIKLSPQAEKGVKKDLIKQDPGKIVIINDFDTPNIIDVVDWSKIKRPEAPKKDISPNLKNKYTTGKPFLHNLYGKGIIKKTKKISTDESGTPIYDIVVDFGGGKERKFRVGTKQSVNV